ncbi:acylphosphatase-2-like isoform X1 [Gadus macrocephalus]|uniref:acylphosphatase-2-like isoform X1 n=1 Tax=Gadus chalcogrammus TaxID=1042646 RepID=UPI0024C3249F|nr:acylphosphatase-2-like isoform X1 [Gadus chalcogrammus]XP_059903911.1 acylphosphatase-2-like isoform X1 [Gadus macrocephalus]
MSAVGWLIVGLLCFSKIVMSDQLKLKSVDFEIFGNVQGVCFRMYTEQEGRSLGLSGWVQNTRRGSVIGQIQGAAGKVDQMKDWLRNVGSPSSRIDRAVFSNERDLKEPELKGFKTRH